MLVATACDLSIPWATRALINAVSSPEPVTRTAWRIGRVTPRASWTDSAAPATIVRSMTPTMARAVHRFCAASTSALSFMRLKFAAARSAADFSRRSIASLYEPISRPASCVVLSECWRTRPTTR